MGWCIPMLLVILHKSSWLILLLGQSHWVRERSQVSVLPHHIAALFGAGWLYWMCVIKCTYREVISLEELFIQAVWHVMSKKNKNTQLWQVKCTHHPG